MKPYYEHGGITIYHGDCREILPTLPSVNLVVTDPPYHLLMASTASESKTGGWGDMMNGAMFYAAILREVKRLTENTQGAAWVFNSWRSLPVLTRAAYDADWGIESCMVWDKQWIGPGGQRGLRPSYELAALFCHRGFAISDRGIPDIWRCQWSSYKPHGHPAEKPEKLLSRMITVSGSGGDLMLDPFVGSGTTLRAAKDSGRRAIGIEIEERYCEIAANRLSQEAITF